MLESEKMPYVQIGHDDTGFIRNRIGELAKIRDRIKPGCPAVQIGQDDLLEILENAAQLSLAVRPAIIEPYPVFKKRAERLRGLMFEFTIPAHAILRIKLPPLMGRNFKGAYDIYWALKPALAEHLCQHPVRQYSGEKLLLIYKKYATNLSVPYTCDNDNWEAKRTTNAISEEINYSDNAGHFSFLYTAAESKSSFVEVTLLEISELKHFLGYLTEK